MIGVIVQARTGSTRFPGKIYADINGRHTLSRVLEGVTHARMPHKIILAMPKYDKADFENRERLGEFDHLDGRFSTYFGSPDDVLDRYASAARQNELDLIVRVTADCPLIQGWLIDQMLAEYLRLGLNGFMGCNSTVASPYYPDGMDVEIFPYWMLMEADAMAECDHYREHVTPFMYRPGTQYDIHRFNNFAPHTQITTAIPNFSFDTPEDYNLIKRISVRYDTHHDLNTALCEVAGK